MAENWLSKKIKNLGKGSELDKIIGEHVAAVNAAAEAAPTPAQAAVMQAKNGDDLMNIYKAALFGSAQPQDVMFGGQVIGFEPVTGTNPLPQGFPAELYEQMLKHSPKFKPFLRTTH